MMMRRMLLQSGYEVEAVKDGAEAVERIFQEDGPRLLILDWMMPQLDGPEVCRAIRTVAQRPYVYIILLTAKYLKNDIVAGLQAGADDYLTKPCDSAELRARLQTGQRILLLEDSLVSAREEMRFRATHDALTLIHNRGAIVHAFSAALEEARRSQEDLSVLLCDIDHFKSINDTYGHPVGDEVLREVARRLQSTIRPGDLVGRFGGEEFLCVLRNCGADLLSSRAADICEAIRSRAVQTSAGPVFVSISAGAFSLFPHDLSSGIDPLLHKADCALYRAKKEGRNRVVLDMSMQSLASRAEERVAVLRN